MYVNTDGIRWILIANLLPSLLATSVLALIHSHEYRQLTRHEGVHEFSVVAFGNALLNGAAWQHYFLTFGNGSSKLDAFKHIFIIICFCCLCARVQIDGKDYDQVRSEQA